jgi:histidinol-phosphate aminotransferase
MCVLRDGLAKLGLSCVDGEANFILVKFGPRAKEIFETLQKKGYIIRPVANYGLPEYLRISVGTPEQNVGLLETLGGIVGAVKR